MNKNDVVRALAVEAGITQTEAKSVVESMLNIITTGLINEGKVQFPGFGTFTCKERAARKGRNPSTGESIDIAATNVVKFKVGATLKSDVN